MYVSYPELYALCVKALRSYDLPQGIAEATSEIVAWSEFVGIPSMEVLLNELNNLDVKTMVKVQEIKNEKHVSILEGYKGSGLIKSRLAADYLLSKAYENDHEAAVYLINVSCSLSLVKNISINARHGFGGIMQWLSKDGASIWAIVYPNQSYPTIIRGDLIKGYKKHETIEKYFGKNGKFHLPVEYKVAERLLMICTDNITLLDCISTELRDTLQGSNYIYNPHELSRRKRISWDKGLKISKEKWNILHSLPNRLEDYSYLDFNTTK